MGSREREVQLGQSGAASEGDEGESRKPKAEGRRKLESRKLRAEIAISGAVLGIGVIGFAPGCVVSIAIGLGRFTVCIKSKRVSQVWPAKPVGNI
jgi:hypothetical protein